MSSIKEKLNIYIEKVKDFFNKNGKMAFPIIVVVAVAIVVSIALGLKNRGIEEIIDTTEEETISQNDISVIEDIPMVYNTDERITAVICAYYNAFAYGDEEGLRSVCDEISDSEMLRYLETSKYIDHYPVLEIYTKPGIEEGSYIAYVYYRVVFVDQDAEYPAYMTHYICTDENGNLYIKRGETSDAVNEYNKAVSMQDDVVELNNKVTVEYNELITARPELFKYLTEMDALVGTAVGEELANLNGTVSNNNVDKDNTEGDAEGVGETGAQASNDENGVPRYATSTTTVNVRASDSEKADKLGKVSGGTKLEVLEIKENGWTKIVFEGKEGFIKTEFLSMSESADGLDAVGQVTATTNINVRAAASETADRLGILAGGESAELISNEGDWCKIKYNGQVGYVKSEYVQ